MSDQRAAALEYHRDPTPGKLEITPTKPLENQADLALAYSPGVAYACEAIAADPALAAEYTARANLVAVVTNGTAVLGLGAIGPLAAKPVMEGKAVLFKKFAGIDAVDIEIDADDPGRLIDVVAALEPSFGGINLEDIRAPECFEVEEQLRARMKIPVFHDDQHGTAIIVAAAVLNACELTGRALAEVKLVTSGAGAAALSCLNMLVALGLPRENITATDIAGVIYQGRAELMDERKARFAQPTPARTLAEVIEGADIFLGLSAGGVLKPEMVAKMAPRPIVLALANPEPEIRPEAVRQVRDDAIIATGRTDYPNQVNNVLCFPFIFRGALDVGATTVTESMKVACVQALAALAKAEASEVVQAAYPEATLRFGPEYLIPKPFDPRLLGQLAPAVAKAAIEAGVASRPIEDLDAYRARLEQFVWRSGLAMRPLLEAARRSPMRVVYAEGDDPRTLRAVQQVVDLGVARPCLVGDPDRIEAEVSALGLRLRQGEDYEVLSPHDPWRVEAFVSLYHQLMARRGVTAEIARKAVQRQRGLLAALMVRCGEADAMLCGLRGSYFDHLAHVTDVVGLREGVAAPAALSALVVRRGVLFVANSAIDEHPSAADLAQTTLLAAEAVRMFGRTPKVALVSHSHFGSHDTQSARRVREAVAILHQRAPELAVDGEMHVDAAMLPALRNGGCADCRLDSEANVLVMPSLDAAHISFNLLRAVADGLAIGPLLLGMRHPAHILHPSASARTIVNLTATATVGAQRRAAESL